MVGDAILIKKDAIEQEKGGIIIPEQYQQKPRRATILAIGPGREIVNPMLGKEVDERVVCPNCGGTLDDCRVCNDTGRITQRGVITEPVTILVPVPDYIKPGVRVLIRKYAEDDVPVGDDEAGLSMIKPGSILAILQNETQAKQ